MCLVPALFSREHCSLPPENHFANSLTSILCSNVTSSVQPPTTRLTASFHSRTPSSLHFALQFLVFHQKITLNFSPSKHTVLPSGGLLQINPHHFPALLCITGNCDPRSLALWLPGGAANGRHWQKVDRWEEGKGWGTSLSSFCGSSNSIFVCPLHGSISLPISPSSVTQCLPGCPTESLVPTNSLGFQVLVTLPPAFVPLVLGVAAVSCSC